MKVGWQTSRLTLMDFVPIVLYLNESETQQERQWTIDCHLIGFVFTVVTAEVRMPSE